MTDSTVQHPWSSEALFSKALLYVEEMEHYPAEDWRFGFWSSLSLELIARAALSAITLIDRVVIQQPLTVCYETGSSLAIIHWEAPTG